VCYLTDDLRALLETERAATDDPRAQDGADHRARVPPSRPADPRLRRAWAAACANAEVPGRRVLDLRRTTVRNLVRAGVPDRVAM
jgi:hypothetical protein